MLSTLIKKDFRLLIKDWPKLLFSLSLYIILLLSYQIVFPSYKSQTFATPSHGLLYAITLISFVIQSYFIKFESDPDYNQNIIGYIYKLHGNLYSFIFSKFLTLIAIALLHTFMLLLILMISEAPLTALLYSSSIFFYMTICALMLLFANSLTLRHDTGFYALIVLPFIIPYMLLSIGVADNWHYLLIILGIVLLKVPIVLFLVAIMLARDV